MACSLCFCSSEHCECPARRSALTTWTRLVLALVVTTLLAVLPLYANLEDALQAYRRGDYGAAIRLFRVAAEAGEETAMFSLGFMYLRGEGVPVDAAEAAHWLRLAAERGVAPAQHSLALLYYEGRGVERNTAVAANYFESAALQGLADAQYNLGVLYSRGDGVRQDWALAQFWHRKAADQGVTDAQLALGTMLANGHGVERDYLEASRWFGKAAADGNQRARRIMETGFSDLSAAGTGAAAPPLPREPPTPPDALAASQTPARAAPAEPPPVTAPTKHTSTATPGESRAGEVDASSWERPPKKLTADSFRDLQSRAVSGDISAQVELSWQYLHGVSAPQNLVRSYVWAVRAERKGSPAGAQLAAVVLRRMSATQRAAATTILDEP